MVTVLGGLLGTVAGHLELTSPVEMMLPKSMTGKGFVKSLVHPYAAQITDLVGDPKPRPAAPWGYTNTWGNNYCLLVGWFVVAVFGYPAKRRVRIAALVVLGLSLIPGGASRSTAGCGSAWALPRSTSAARQACWARSGPLLVAGAAAVVIAVALTSATPLGDVVQRRLDNGKSNGVRMYLTERALDGAARVAGARFRQHPQHHRRTAVHHVGESEACERCGNFTDRRQRAAVAAAVRARAGGHRSPTSASSAYALWRFRTDTSPIGIGGVDGDLRLVRRRSLWYNSLVTPLAFIFLAYVLLWRNNMLPLPLNPKSTSPTRERQCPPDESEDGTAAADSC